MKCYIQTGIIRHANASWMIHILTFLIILSGRFNMIWTFLLLELTFEIELIIYSFRFHQKRMYFCTIFLFLRISNLKQ